MFHPPAECATLVDVLANRAEKQADRRAYTFLGDGEHESETLTWSELWTRSGSVAAALYIDPGARALLVYEPGLDYLVALLGCMRAGVLAVPAHPPDARGASRLDAIAGSASAAVVLTHGRLADEPGWTRALAPRSIRTDALAPAEPTPYRPKREDVAYLQYTSGSTSEPKGVRVTHRCLMHQLADFDTGYDHRPDSVMVTWLPATHDLGLVYGYLMPLFIGFPCVGMPPDAFIARPVAWPAAVSKYRGTHSPAPNFAFELAARKCPPDASLDLSSWCVALNGAEPIHRSSEELFLATYARFGLRSDVISHAYGMSEATAKISSEHRGTPRLFARVSGREVAGCGVTTGDTVVAIVDPVRCTMVPDGEEGEIWVRGTTVADGYFGRPDLTRETFDAHTADGAGPFLRTGDLGFVRDRNVYVTGRKKDLIILRGENYHPQDLERAVHEAHSALRSGATAAFSVDGRDSEQLVLVAEIRPELLAAPSEVFAALRQRLATAGVQAQTLALLPPRALPKTTSGKLQRTRTRAQFLDGSLEVLHRWDRPEAPEPRGSVPAPRDGEGMIRHVAARVAQALGVDPEDIPVDRPLRELGVDSVTAVGLVERLGADLGRTIRTSAAFDHPTVAAIALFLLQEQKPAQPDPSASTPITAAEALRRELEDLGLDD